MHYSQSERTENAIFVANATLDAVNLIANNRQHTEPEISRAVKALASIDWNRKVLGKLSNRINATFRWLRSSKLKKEEYLRIRDKLITTFSEKDDIVPLSWGKWGKS